MSDDIDLTKFPMPPKWQEVIATTIKVALAAAPNPLGPLAPNIGGPTAELVSAFFTPALRKRQIEWLEYWGRSVARLQEQMRETDLMSLLQRPAAVSAFVQATQIALRTHQREKWRELRAAYLNVVAGTAPEEDLQPALMNLIEALTPCEMQLLTFFYVPSRFGIESISDLDYPYHNGHGPAKREALQRVTCLGGQSYRYEFFVNDLTIRGLLEMPKSTLVDANQEVAWALNPGQSTDFRLDYRAPRASAMAQQLVMLIQSPISGQDEDGQDEPGQG